MRPLILKGLLLEHILIFLFLHPLVKLVSSTNQPKDVTWQKNILIPRYDQWSNVNISTQLPSFNILRPKLNSYSHLPHFTQWPNPNTFPQPPRYTLKSKLNVPAQPPRFTPKPAPHPPTQLPRFTLKTGPNLLFQHPRSQLKSDSTLSLQPPNFTLKPVPNILTQPGRYTFLPNSGMRSGLPSLSLDPKSYQPIQLPPKFTLKPEPYLPIKPPRMKEYYLPIQPPRFTLYPRSFQPIHPPEFTLKPGPYLPIKPPRIQLKSESYLPIQPPTFTLKPESYLAIQRPDVTLRAYPSNPQPTSIHIPPPRGAITPDSNLSIQPLRLKPGPYPPIQPPRVTIKPELNLPIQPSRFTLKPGPYLPIQPLRVTVKPEFNLPFQPPRFTLKPGPNLPIQPPRITVKPEFNLPFQPPRFTLKPGPFLPTQPPRITVKPESSISLQHPRVTLKPNASISNHLPKYIQRSRPNSSINIPKYTQWPQPNESLVHLPKLNLWPWIPLPTPAPIPDKLHSKPDPLLPDHNFWPWVPLKNPKDEKTGRENVMSQLPTHNFWPFIPVSPSRNDSLKPTPDLPPTKKPFPSAPNRYNYGEVMYKSILFYEVQRSGWLPNNRKIKWRSHSAVGDQGFLGEDLSGGWYDAGDYIKFGAPMANAASMLLWGLLEYPDAYKSTGLYDDVLASVKWPLDYFLKAHSNKYELYGQVGDPYIDHTYWGRPEDMEMERPAYKLTPNQPGSDLAADTATAMALGYLAFKDVDPPYAKRLLEHAMELFEFADFYRGGYTNTIENAWEFYRSYSDEDELAWAAIWLYRATLNAHYLNKAKYYFDRMDECWAQSWADKSCSVPVLMYQMTRGARFKAKVESIMSQWLPGGEIDYTLKGLAYRGPWGTLRYTANMAFIAMRAADLDIRPAAYRNWARSQIHYMLGDGGRSYVVGYGHNPPTRPHHAASSCESPPEPCTWEDYTKPEPNFHTLFGALVGGPDLRDNFVDSRSDYIHNEVGCEYNAGFQSSLAALKSLELQMPP